MRNKRKTLDNKDDIKKKIAKKQRVQERGITLIALVVTIIILLILSGVTLNIALSDNGLFSKAKKATEDYKEAQSDEEDSIRQISTQLYSEYIGATVEGYSPANNEATVTINGTTSGLSGKNDDKGNVIIGVEENGDQKFSVDKDMKWRIWDFDGNTLRIIGDPTTEKLTLQGVAGYNNGVWAIEEICRKLYSNEEKGAIATSLKRTDIQRVSTYDYTQNKHQDNSWIEDTTSSDDENLIHFGESKTYSEPKKCPQMWYNDDQSWTYDYDKETKKATGADKECRTWEDVGTGKGEINEDKDSMKSSEATLKQSCYFHRYSENEFLDEKYYGLIFGTKNINYWLAGRHVQLFKDGCSFGVHFVEIKEKATRFCFAV